MNPTGKAGRPRNKPPDLKGLTQFDRFVETAKALEADESGVAFDRAMDAIAPAQHTSRQKQTVNVKQGTISKRGPPTR